MASQPIRLNQRAPGSLKDPTSKTKEEKAMKTPDGEF